ncbi:hypothetical protein SUGI_0732280 [Cryptomeria japonica]|nr:hypothetical protein SUGI_0732280 [Cryptomeria japonica]
MAIIGIELSLFGIERDRDGSFCSGAKYFSGSVLGSCNANSCTIGTEKHFGFPVMGSIIVIDLNMFLRLQGKSSGRGKGKLTQAKDAEI